ncbi:MAG: GNAT family N-acetyltransferase [Eubacteriales bacterium]|nr:GNAT family N-acetyltransferase [Eubacteriales bacterium]
MSYIYRKVMPEDVRPALDLALRVFMEFEAPEYESEAVDKFKADIVYNEQFIKNWEHGTSAMYVALDNDKVVGVIGEKWNNGHINIVFVDGNYHRKGIATELMNHMVCDLKLRGFDKITLFSSPYGLLFYLNYGFSSTDVEQHSDGFIYIPMAYTPNEIWDVYDENRNLTGRYIERGRPRWQKGNYHLVVHVWKRNAKGDWLIDRRTPRKTDNLGGLWETTGGSAVAGDSSLDAALRETKEELGLTLLPESGRLFHSYINKGFNGYTGFIDVWVFDCDCSLEDIVLQESETCDVMWASSDKIKEMIENSEFIGREIYPYLDRLLGYEV